MRGGADTAPPQFFRKAHVPTAAGLHKNTAADRKAHALTAACLHRNTAADRKAHALTAAFAPEQERRK